MHRSGRARVIAAISLAATYLFFFEYLPPFRRVFVPYDLQGYHYSWTDYAFQALRSGRFPQWDPTIYCGLDFPGNIQAALFYPPTWLVFAANLGRHAVSYQSLQDFIFLHVWLAFFLCYVWLRHKRLTGLACILGGAVFAFSGYLCEQLQHLGLVVCYAWMPLGLWGIDEAVEQRRWRPLWKVVAASALGFLGGYPPTWFVFAVCMLVYAGWRWRVFAGVAAALAASLLLVMVQLLPVWAVAALKFPEIKYGSGIRDPAYLLAALVPNYRDFAIHAGDYRDQYLYLGAPALIGFLYLLRRFRRESLPLLPMAAAALVLVANPGDLVSRTLRHSSMLALICRDWYFLAGLALAAAPLAALGLDSALRAKPHRSPRWLPPLTVGLLAAWSVVEAVHRMRGRFPVGWGSALEAGILLILCALAIYLLPGQNGRQHTWLAAALLVAVGVDYKVHGTVKWFDAAEGRAPAFSTAEFVGMDDAVYRQLREHPGYRIAIDTIGPLPEDFRHYGFTSPQGGDPFLPAQYRELMTARAHFRTDRVVDLDPAREDTLRLLGVRYYLTTGRALYYPSLLKNPHFRLLQPPTSYYKVFELLDAHPPYGWENGGGTVRLLADLPELRSFAVASPAGGRFTLAEQFFPGWRATVDGVPAPLLRWQGAFQAVEVPPGEHRVEFRFRAPGLVPGALISLASLGAFAFVVFRSRKRG